MDEIKSWSEWTKEYRMEITRLSECIERFDYQYREQKGYIYLCRPWASVTVWANKVYMETLPGATDSSVARRFIKLNYCTKGRCEVFLENGKYIYMSDGALSIDSSQVDGIFRYPTGEYDGLEIVIDLDALKKQPIEAFDELGIRNSIWDEKLEEDMIYGKTKLKSRMGVCSGWGKESEFCI